MNYELHQNCTNCTMPTHSRMHICKPTRANAQTKGLQKSFRLSSPSNRLSGRFKDCPRLKKQNKFMLRGKVGAV